MASAGGPEASDDISSFLASIQGQFAPAPLLVAGVAERSSTGYVERFGWSGDVGGSTPEDQVFDLASISKSFFACLTSDRVESGVLEWTTQLQEVLPEAERTWGGSQTIEALLAHRSGLMAHVELFRPSWQGRVVRREGLLRKAASSRHALGSEKPVYSDLGYILVGAALERVTGEPLDALLARHILLPWGIEAGSARAFRKTGKRFVPTEVQPGRGGELIGQVHDDNAWALGGSGLCGHAGVFGTMRGVLTFGERLLDAVHGVEGPVKRSLVEPLIAPRPGGSLRMGFDGISGPATMAGSQASERTFGHLGFTGTSLWCDPDKRRVTVLLCNRVAPTRNNPRISLVRPKIHDFLWSC